jgi:hypothetical protein
MGTVTLAAGNTSLTASWAAVAGASQYEVYYNTSSSMPATAAQTVTATQVTITALTNGTTYYVWVKPKNANGTGLASTAVNAQPIGNMGTVTLAIGNASITASWAAVSGASQYEVYYSTSASIPATAAQTVTTTQATMSGLTNGTVYYVWIKPKNANGTGLASAVVNAQPIGNIGTVTLAIGNAKLTASWAAVAGASQYEVYYNTSASIPTSPAQTVTTTQATMSGLTNETAYYVWVKPKNPTVTGAASAVVSATPSIVGLHKGATFETAARIGGQNLEQALTYISGNAVSGDQYYIVLGANETVAPKTLAYSGATVGITLMTDGVERTVQLASNGTLFIVGSNVTLTLKENVTLNGNGISVVRINTSGTLMMNGGKISGSSTDHGLYVDNGTFTMSGGEISGNCGGVHLVNNGTFTMSGGEISSNTTSSGGGGVYIDRGTFTMSDGKISGNTSSSGGGVHVYIGTFTMIGGEISGNTSSSTGGGGVRISYQYGTFTMSGGEISGNTSSNGYGGGGVNVSNGGTFTKSSGVITGYGNDTINGNKVEYGGVVQSNSGHAVYIGSSPVKRLEKTVAATKAVDSSVSGEVGGWTE